MPTSEAHLVAKRAAAWPCTVFLMRSRGRRLPAKDVMRQDQVTGLLLCEPVGERWAATLYGPDMREVVLFLADAQLLRDRNDCRSYRGMEREGGRPRWLQTWLCGPEDRCRSILKEMEFREFGGGV